MKNLLAIYKFLKKTSFSGKYPILCPIKCNLVRQNARLSDEMQLSPRKTNLVQHYIFTTVLAFSHFFDYQFYNDKTPRKC
jgi:hypothetical protein